MVAKRKLSAEQLASQLWKLPAAAEPEPVGNVMPALDELQTYVGGYIEHLACSFAGKPAHLLVNEDGRRQGLPPNEFATLLFAASQHVTAGEIVEQLTRGVRPNVTVVRTLAGNAWLWFGPLPN